MLSFTGRLKDFVALKLCCRAYFRPDYPYCLPRRKNCALSVAGRVTDLFTPSSVTLAELVTQLAGPIRV